MQRIALQNGADLRIQLRRLGGANLQLQRLARGIEFHLYAKNWGTFGIRYPLHGIELQTEQLLDHYVTRSIMDPSPRILAAEDRRKSAEDRQRARAPPWALGPDMVVGGKVNTKKSQIFKAAVTGDTVGDPLKDTSGPALNILMKLMAIISVVFADFFLSINDGGGLISYYL